MTLKATDTDQPRVTETEKNTWLSKDAQDRTWMQKFSVAGPGCVVYNIQERGNTVVDVSIGAMVAREEGKERERDETKRKETQVQNKERTRESTNEILN